MDGKDLEESVKDAGRDDQPLDFRTVYEDVRTVARSRVPSRDVDDVVQEAMTRLLAAAPNVDYTAALAFRLVRNAKINLYRRRTAQKRGDGAQHVGLDSPEAQRLEAPTSSPEAQLLREEQAAGVRAVVASLDPLQRRLLQLWQQGWTSPEMAEALGRTPNATRALLRRTLSKLRTALTPREGTPYDDYDGGTPN